jgi:epoxyqueuosine reductase
MPVAFNSAKPVHQPLDPQQIRSFIEDTAATLGFCEVRVGAPVIGITAQARLDHWLNDGMHGTMAYMARHAELRKSPGALLPGTCSIISVRLPYWPEDPQTPQAYAQLANPQAAYISRYALGRDYHKVIRQRLQKLADAISNRYGAFDYRVFTDSAPVMEVALAQQAGLGWEGKHTLSLTRSGSWYFLGELFTNLPLQPDAPIDAHCGDCQRCLDACPTGAITEPYQVDARRCISYLTIEHDGEIPVELRQAMGNRIYGCDDCQLVCPWNRFAVSGDPAFAPRHGLDQASLLALYEWTEAEFLIRLEGSPIRRIGYERWLRNITVALGNARPTPAIIEALTHKKTHASALVKTHIEWALTQLTQC